MWIKGIVTTVSQNGVFVETTNNTLLVPCRLNQNYQLGDCLEVDVEGRTTKECRRCERFVEFELKKNGKSISLICDVVDVQWRYEEKWNKKVRKMKTDFIEEVYDPPMNLETSVYTNEQLMCSKIVITRVCGNDKVYYWRVIGVYPNQKKQQISETDFIRPLRGSDRTQYKGFICTFGVLKDAQDELYIWVPYRNERDVMLPVGYRNNVARDKFIGKWVSFSMRHSIFLDKESDVHIIDDVLPTRQRAGCWEIKVPCEFIPSTNDRRNPELFSDVCGRIVDPTNTLDMNNRLESFNKDLWVFYQLLDRSNNVRFAVSDQQDSMRTYNSRRTERSPSPERYQSRRTQRTYSDRDGRENIRITRHFDDEEEDRSNRRCSSPEKEPSVTSSNPKPQSSTSNVADSLESLENVRKMLKRLKTKYNYLMENGMDVPEKLTDDLQKAIQEELRLSKKKDYKDFEENSSDTSSSMNRRREKARSEVNEEELKNYKKLVGLFRDMLSSSRVSEEMQKYNPDAMDEINQLLFDM